MFVAVLSGGISKEKREIIDEKVIVYKDYVELSVEAKGKLDTGLFEDDDSENVLSLTQKVIAELPFDEVINNSATVTQEVKKRYEQAGGKLKSLSIRVMPPKDFSLAGLRLKSMPLALTIDSMISVAAKRDAQGYTPEAERLEERRDARYNENKRIENENKRIESNERIKIRQAEAIENAADNMGVLSGNLSVSLGE